MPLRDGTATGRTGSSIVSTGGELPRARPSSRRRTSRSLRPIASGIDVDDEERLLEARCPGDDLALVVEHDRVAVEDELVLATDEVAEGHVARVVARPRHEHLLALLGLAHVEGGGREVDEEMRTGQRKIRRGRPRLPHVLADRRCDDRLAEPQEHQVAPLGEVPVLVEDAVVGQEVLAIDAGDASVGADDAGVGEIRVEPGAADEGDDVRARLRQTLHGRAGGADEPRPEEQVLGRVPGDRQLGQHDEVGVLGPRLGDRVLELHAVAVEVADDDVQLG